MRFLFFFIEVWDRKNLITKAAAVAVEEVVDSLALEHRRSLDEVVGEHLAPVKPSNHLACREIVS